MIVKNIPLNEKFDFWWVVMCPNRCGLVQLRYRPSGWEYHGHRTTHADKMNCDLNYKPVDPNLEVDLYKTPDGWDRAIEKRLATHTH